MFMTVQYQKGKLYKVSHYCRSMFSLYTTVGILNENGDLFRETLTTGTIDGAIFLYLGNIDPLGTSIGFHRVIYQDMIGVVDARMILEPLKEDNNHEE